MKNILVLGGGTAGLIAALMIKSKHPSYGITIIKSDDVGIIGVGEGTTEHWSHFVNSIGLNMREVITETDATFKSGIFYEEWTKDPYFHVITDQMSSMKYGQYKIGYASAIGNNLNNFDVTPSYIVDGIIGEDFLPNQYHFNTFKLNEYLIKICEQRKINIINDSINDVEVDNGKITSITGSGTYSADFYIDCTGFKRVLIGKLDPEFVSCKDQTFVNEAIAFQTDDLENYNPYTISRAMNSGWLWRIPTYGRHGNGYVFNNNFITADEAVKEVEELYGHEIEVAKNIKFETGYLKDSWIGNCCAVGLSSGFFEPLEATSIASTIQQTFLILNSISTYDEQSVIDFNKKLRNIYSNILDFVQLSYMCGKEDTPFWQMVKEEFNPTDRLKYILAVAQKRLLIYENFDQSYLIFSEDNFIVKLHALGLLNLKNIKNEYEEVNELARNHFQEEFNNYQDFKKSSKKMKHKDMLDLIRSNKDNFYGIIDNTIKETA